MKFKHLLRERSVILICITGEGIVYFNIRNEGRVI
jgi:hypothetical protein